MKRYINTRRGKLKEKKNKIYFHKYIYRYKQMYELSFIMYKIKINVYFNNNTCKLIQFECYSFWFGLCFTLVKSFPLIFFFVAFTVNIRFLFTTTLTLIHLLLLFMFVSSRLLSYKHAPEKNKYTHTQCLYVPVKPTESNITYFAEYAIIFLRCYRRRWQRQSRWRWRANIEICFDCIENTV